jgi:hypothetical protein
MSALLYAASVTVFERGLGGLAHVMNKALDHMRANQIDEREMAAARLHETMFPFYRQVQIACDFARKTPLRALGRAIPTLPDQEQSFAELQALVAETKDALLGLAPADFEGRGEVVISVPLGQQTMEMPVAQYVLGFATPNFYFHYVTAYDILRHRGVEIGKRDFFGMP